MKIEEEMGLLVLLAIVDLGDSGTKRQVLDLIETRSWMKLTPAVQEDVKSRKEKRWRNDLAWVRNKLANEGYVSREVRNEWQITQSGTECFRKLCQEARATASLEYISSDAILKIRSMQPDSLPTLSDDNALARETISCEGDKAYRWTLHYERDPDLRAKAIEIHGTICMGCGFSFERAYGDIGRGFIEVHHAKPVSTLERGTVVDPESDMVTLCSNCHSIVHRRKPEPLTLEDLKKVLNGHQDYSTRARRATRTLC